MKENDFIPVNTPLLNGNERRYLIDCIDTGWISSSGDYINKFESEFAKSVNRKHAISVSNGSCALDISFLSLNLKKGDEVIAPTFTIISCISAIIRANATPVLVDASSSDWNMDLDIVEKSITKNTKAILVVHIYGFPVNMDKVESLAKKYSLTIIEDGAELIGGEFNGKKVGSFGVMSCFSFFANKHITCGEGGMVVTDDSVLAEKLKSLRNLGFNDKQRFLHFSDGFNMRMTNMQAALGLAQLERLDSILKIKIEIGKKYFDGLKSLDNHLYFLPPTNKFSNNLYWVFGIVLKSKKVFNNAKELSEKLLSLGIDSRPFFWSMHEQPVFIEKGYFKDDKHPNSEYLSRMGLYIPSGLGLKNEQIQYVINKLNALFKNV